MRKIQNTTLMFFAFALITIASPLLAQTSVDAVMTVDNQFTTYISTDDTVQYQNPMDMITALVKANKQFDLFIYPNKNHGIYGGNTRYHLYKKMTDFLFEHLKNEDNK